MLPQSCCQTCPMFRRQQLTLFSTTVSIYRSSRQRKSPVCPTSSSRGLFAAYLQHQFFKLVFILLPWQCLFLQDAGKRLELGILFLAPLLAPSGLPLGMVWEKPDLSGSAGAAFALPPCLSLSHSCQLPSVFLKTA